MVSVFFKTTFQVFIQGPILGVICVVVQIISVKHASQWIRREPSQVSSQKAQLRGLRGHLTCRAAEGLRGSSPRHSPGWGRAAVASAAGPAL